MRSFNEMADNVEAVLDQQRAFVADASHQLRNPLSALLLRIELLGLELPEGHTEAESVKEEGRRLAQVLDDLLGLAVAESSGNDLAMIDIAAMARVRTDAWRAVADRAEVALEFTGPPDGRPVTGWADSVALSSALDAVLDNAIKFTPAGAAVGVRVAVEGDSVALTVADGGPGLGDDELARIGDRFWRSARHQNVQGSGLGLSIAAALLRQGGGAIRYGHHEPSGLEVVLTVPRSAPAPAA
jgi:signal transduction histidine kinase